MSYRSNATSARREPEQTVSISPKQLVAFIETAWAVGRVPCAWGSYGIGKSQVVHQIGQRREARVFETRLAQMDNVDVRGLPFLEEGRTHWGDPSCFPPADYEGECVVFLDEANRAPVGVMNAAFQLIDQRRIGDYTLPAGALVVLACNREQDGGGVNPMPAALANRLLHAYPEPSVPDWLDWGAQNDIAPSILAYVKWSGNLNVPSPKDKVSPTPRTWHIASDVVKQRLPDEQVELALLAGAVGYKEATGYLAYRTLFKTLPSISAILDDPAGAEVPAEMSTQYAVASALSRVADDRNLGDVITYLNRLPQEFASFAIQLASQRDPVLAQTGAFVAWKAGLNGAVA